MKSIVWSSLALMCKPGKINSGQEVDLKEDGTTHSTKGLRQEGALIRVRTGRFTTNIYKDSLEHPSDQ